MKPDNWRGLYREGWGSRLRPASFAHPAKNSYSLSVRIYEHALAEGWVKPGDYVVDCFSGIGGFALEAMRHGLNFVGVELEQRFVDMSQGCNCSGINKADWVRFQGRWDRARYKDGRHWCPECVMKAGAVMNERKFKAFPLPGTKWAALAKTRQATLFDAAPMASYVRNSGKIPCTGAHRYHGNIETWEAQGMPGTAVIVQGDSRRLGEVLAEAQLCLSSPPYANSEVLGGSQDEGLRGAGWAGKRSNQQGDYGQTEGNLGNLPDTGFEAALAVASPVYYSSTASDDPDKRGGLYRDPKRRGDKTLTATYSEDEAQLAQMPEGDLVAVISSPPYIESLERRGQSPEVVRERMRQKGWSEKSIRKVTANSNDTQSGYGSEQGQLAQMPPGDHAAALEAGAGAATGRAQACISSPPFSQPGMQPISSRKELGGQGVRSDYRALGLKPENNYGTTPGQLGQQQGSTFWAASRQILEQVYQVLAPGGHAIWVVKMFVRNKQLVDFPGQWEALCQSVGFKTVCKHRAWMNKDAGVVQIDFDGDEVSMEKWYKSFFRILCEKKGAPRIDFETVLCMVKPERA